MKPGIKPSHLWHWTPRKYFESIIYDRLSLKHLDQRSKIDIIKTNLVVATICISLMYSFGVFCPKEIVTRILRERSCDTSAQSKESNEPAPGTKPKDPPCPPRKKQPPTC